MLPPGRGRLLAGIGHGGRSLSAAVPLRVVGAELHGGPREQEEHGGDEKHHASRIDPGAPPDEWQKGLRTTKSCHAAVRDYPGLPCPSLSASSGCPTSGS